MGDMHSSETAERTNMDDIESMRQSVIYQLRGNHYPPHPMTMVELAMDSLLWFKKELATFLTEDEFEHGLDWDTLFEVPTEVDEDGDEVPIGKYKGREDGMIPFGGIIQMFHLDSWLHNMYRQHFDLSDEE